MKKILISPSKYVQGEGELNNLGEYLKAFGNKALLVASSDDQARVQVQLDDAMKKDSFSLVSCGFRGECSKVEVARIKEIAEKSEYDVLIGLGGGKALDTAKTLGFYQKKPVIVVPTIASTDAPCSSLAVLYTEEGQFDEYIFFGKNPDLVLVDLEIIAKAPTRFLVAGMGDALATYFEARSCERSLANNIPGGKSTKTALAVAKLCYEILIEDSIKAKAACDSKDRKSVV